MASAEQQPEVLELVVGADGSGVIDATQLALLGVKPGTHLNVVPVGRAWAAERRRSVRGALAGSGPAPSPDDFEAASAAAGNLRPVFVTHRLAFLTGVLSGWTVVFV